MTEQLLKLGHRQIACSRAMTPASMHLNGPESTTPLRAEGIDPAQVREISTWPGKRHFPSARDILHLRPRPTAVIAFDDSLGSMLRFQAQRTKASRCRRN